MSRAAGIGGTRWTPWRRRSKGSTSAATLIEHLRELRKRLTISVIAFVLLSVIAFFFYNPILALIRRPLCLLDGRYLGPQGCDLIFTQVGGGFAFRLKVTALTGILFASPIWLYQMWAFITPGLTSKEKKYALPFVLSSGTLFAIGAVVAFLSLPTGLRLLLTIGGDGLVAFLEAERYLSFVGLMMLGFGVMFELPVFLLFLGLVGVVTVQQLRHHRKTAVVSIVALAAVVTPSQDPYTMLALAAPLYVMFEGTVLALRLVERKRKRKQNADSRI